MVPLYGETTCPSCAFIDSFGGADWYVCNGGHTPLIVAHYSRQPHDTVAMPVDRPPSGGMWKRAYLLAINRAMIPEKG